MGRICNLTPTPAPEVTRAERKIMTYITDIRQAGNLYIVTLIGSDGLTVEVGAAPSMSAARRMARIAAAATSECVTVQPINL